MLYRHASADQELLNCTLAWGFGLLAQRRPDDLTRHAIHGQIRPQQRYPSPAPAEEGQKAPLTCTTLLWQPKHRRPCTTHQLCHFAIHRLRWLDLHAKLASDSLNPPSNRLLVCLTKERRRRDDCRRHLGGKLCPMYQSFNRLS